MPRHRSARTILPLLALALAAAPAASAATIATDADGAVVVVTGGGATGLDLGVERDGRVRIAPWFDDPITSVSSACEPAEDDPYMARCVVGSAGLRVLLGDGNDAATVHTPLGVPVTIDGGDGADVLLGSLDGGDETFLGGAGDDALNGRGGDDVVDGGDGDDGLSGGPGADKVLGGPGGDTLLGDDNGAVDPDLVDGGPGSDTLEGEYLGVGREGRGPVTVSLDAGRDDGFAGEHDDLRAIERVRTVAGGRYVGTDADDELYVGAESTTVEGRGGNDTIFTSYADDVIDGGAGADTIRGYAGADRIAGGPGPDTLYGDTADHTCNALTCTIHSGNDVIDARDGERDSIDCGLGTDQALVDRVDVHTNCEDVRVAGDRTVAPDAAGAPGAVGLTVQRRSLRTALVRGVVVRLTGARPGRVGVTARWHGRVVARGVARVTSDGRGRALVRFTAGGRRLLGRKERVTLRVTAGRSAALVRLTSA